MDGGMMLVVQLVAEISAGNKVVEIPGKAVIQLGIDTLIKDGKDVTAFETSIKTMEDYEKNNVPYYILLNIDRQVLYVVNSVIFDEIIDLAGIEFKNVGNEEIQKYKEGLTVH